MSVADYEASWVQLKLGPVPLFVPNTKSRRRAVVIGIAIGAIIAPRRSWRAWKKGRACRTLYDGTPHEELLALSLEELRARLEEIRS